MSHPKIGNIFIMLGKSLNKAMKEFMMLPISGQVLLGFFVVIVMYWLLSMSRTKEGFTSTYSGLSGQAQDFIQLENEDIYDTFYADVYDDITFDDNRMLYEVDQITNLTGIGKTSRVLDVGCGTGRFVNQLTKQGIPCDGVDRSSAMISKGHAKFSVLGELSDMTGLREGTRTRIGDALDPTLVPPTSLTHVLCLFYTIYCIRDHRTFIANVAEWLKTGGYFVVHMVNRNKFSTIMPAADPFLLVNPQKYAKQRITESSIVFRDMEYKAMFDVRPKHDELVLTETFKDPERRKTRKQVQNLSMPTQRSIVDMILEYGFSLKGKIDMEGCGYDHQYLYVFVKD